MNPSALQNAVKGALPLLEQRYTELFATNPSEAGVVAQKVYDLCYHADLFSLANEWSRKMQAAFQAPPAKGVRANAQSPDATVDTSAREREHLAATSDPSPDEATEEATFSEKVLPDAHKEV